MANKTNRIGRTPLQLAQDPACIELLRTAASQHAPVYIPVAASLPPAPLQGQIPDSDSSGSSASSVSAAAAALAGFEGGPEADDSDPAAAGPGSGFGSVPMDRLPLPNDDEDDWLLVTYRHRHSKPLVEALLKALDSLSAEERWNDDAKWWLDPDEPRLNNVKVILDGSNQGRLTELLRAYMRSWDENKSKIRGALFSRHLVVKRHQVEWALERVWNACYQWPQTIFSFRSHYEEDVPDRPVEQHPEQRASSARKKTAAKRAAAPANDSHSSRSQGRGRIFKDVGTIRLSRDGSAMPSRPRQNPEASAMMQLVMAQMSQAAEAHSAEAAWLHAIVTKLQARDFASLLPEEVSWLTVRFPELLDHFSGTEGTPR